MKTVAPKKHFGNMMYEQYPIVYDKIQCIYSPVCKVASNSLIRYLTLTNGDADKESYNSLIAKQLKGVRHKSLFSPLKDSPMWNRHLSYFMETNEYKNYFKFAFVRNPWTRVVAAFRELLRYSPFGTPEVAWKAPFGLSYQKIYDCMEGYISFENFINFIVNIEYGELLKQVKTCKSGYTDLDIEKICPNFHWRQQVELLHIPTMEYDFIGKIENSNQDFNYVQERLGLEKTDLYKDHVTSKYDYRLYYQNSKTIDLVGEYYKRDIEQFGYTYNDNF
jgi:hypothetical protein